MLHVPQPRAEGTHGVSCYPSAKRGADLGRTVLTHTAGHTLLALPSLPPQNSPRNAAQPQESSTHCWPCHPSMAAGIQGFPRVVPPRTLSQLPPPQIQTSCRPTPRQTEDFSDIIFLALLPPASPQAKKFFHQWEAGSSFKNREILSRQALDRPGCGCGKEIWLLQLEEGTPPEAKAGREMSQSPLTAACSRLMLQCALIVILSLVVYFVITPLALVWCWLSTVPWHLPLLQECSLLLPLLCGQSWLVPALSSRNFCVP